MGTGTGDEGLGMYFKNIDVYIHEFIYMHIGGRIFKYNYIQVSIIDIFISKHHFSELLLHFNCIFSPF